MLKLAALLLTAALPAGCQTANSIPTKSNQVSVTGLAASAIAGDMASRFAEYVSASPTRTLKINKDTSEYAGALEAALKGWGYLVVTDRKTAEDPKPMELAWSIDNSDGQVLAQLATSSVTLARAYIPTTSGATPASPLSIMRRN
ncbi:conjugal transfer protein TrbH [Rhizobium sp. Root1203]|uniref:conjugal transfer protein TrbH n=1 Tax=Rhizobium sp. Root1203 TaxID=1736427 RepID=UPI00070951A5|nr:conjugal transfer protein TrbH [Rhizobium sp. Root1203]KQV28916.1 conjugal transfer protein TrbH [Rhizobium sp. Root1203]